jgi:hypothetical protein
MKTSRFKTAYRKNASKLHRQVGDILKSSPLFAGHKIYQEYPVVQISPDYPHSNQWFDWVVLDLKLVIECHGKQHEEAVRFGGTSLESAEEKFVQQKYRDTTKMEAAIKAGFTYICVFEKDKKHLNDTWLWDLYRISSGTDTAIKQDFQAWVKEQQREKDPRAKDRKARARMHRHEQYERAKRYKEQLKNETNS